MAVGPYVCVGVRGCISRPLQVNPLYLHLRSLYSSCNPGCTLESPGGKYQCRGLTPSDSNYRLTLEQHEFELCGFITHIFFNTKCYIVPGWLNL